MPEMQYWEYRVETFGTAFRSPHDEELTAGLNAWGEEGWEVVSVYQMENSVKVRVVARRPLTREARRQRSWPGD